MRKLFLALSLPVLLTAIATAKFPASAAPSGKTSPRSTQISLNFTVPNRGAPTSTAGGATRGSCLRGTKFLTPLLPKERLGLTLSERPSFFVFVPPSPTQNAEFLLLSNDDTEVVYQSNFILPSSPGIVRFDLPADAPPLQIGKQYHWYITLNCNPTLGPGGNPGVEGWVERTQANPTLARQLASASPEKRPSLYANAGIWHETLSSLAALRYRSPNDTRLLDDWQSLLKSVGLDPFVNEPLVEPVAK